MDYAEIRRAAIEQGWRVGRVRNGENFYSPDGKTIVNWHATPSDVRAIRNFLARTRRGGLEWPPPRGRG